MKNNPHILLALLVCWLSACSAPDVVDASNGVFKPDTGQQTMVSFVGQVKPIMDSRCVACHACYDAPCQLKLTAYEGITRGISKQRVYDHKSLEEGELSRLFFDAHGESEWRENGFSSVLQQAAKPGSAKVADASFSSLAGMLDLKQKEQDISSSKILEIPIDDSEQWQCSSSHQEFVDYAADYPKRGMPYGLPTLNSEDSRLIKAWISQGANDDRDLSLGKFEKSQIKRWEALLNQPGPKQQLIARYIYEHLFLASIYFDGEFSGRFFELVRSSTAPSTPIKVIATRRPFDDPGVERVYYRLRLNKETVVAKTHMPYLMGDDKFNKWQNWFYKPSYVVDDLPSYQIETASNPFETFRQLPAEARYRFMLDEANFIVKGFIKGPVCKGQSAVNVINEHFWVFFIDPKYQSGPEMEEYLSSVQSELSLPAEKEDTLDLFGAWDEFAEKERTFLEHRREFIKRNVNAQGAFDTKVLWDGEGINENAALTIYRHFDNATVHKGLSGQTPKTMWVIDYPLLERIHYLLVAGYDVYGNISHNLLSRIYMDFLRMEGESLFLLMLPQTARVDLRQHWYRDADDRIANFMSLSDMDKPLEPIQIVPGADPKEQVLEKIRDKLSKVIASRYDFTQDSYDYPSQLLTQLAVLQARQSAAFDYLAEVTMVEVRTELGSHYLTMLKNRGHLNNTSILAEGLNLKLEETGLTFLPGMVGPRPNAFVSLKIEELDRFGEALMQLSSENDYAKFMDGYGVRRTKPDFWQTFDRFGQGFKKFSEVDHGVLDLNKLENR